MKMKTFSTLAIIGEIISDDDSHFNNLLHLLQIFYNKNVVYPSFHHLQG